MMLSSLVTVLLAAAPPQVADGPLMRALRDEVGRAKTDLALPGMERPYLIVVRVEDESQSSVLASFGALDRDTHYRTRQLRVQVRVGDPALDNSNFVSMRTSMFGGHGGLPLEDDYGAIRRVVWLSIDEAYKEALEALAKKRATLKTHTRPESQTTDLSLLPPKKTYGAALSASLEAKTLPERLRQLSGTFRKYPVIQDSHAEMAAVMDEQYLVDSDGTEAYQTQSIARFRVVGTTQAADGMRLGRSAEMWAASPAELENSTAVEGLVTTVAQELVALREAPVPEDYTGPVLFEGRAAPQLAFEMLSRRLQGTPPPLAENPALATRYQDTDLARRVGQRVADAALSVDDDPLQSREGSQLLIGAYAVDDEGVPAQRVSLIKAGVLKGFLMSRTPRDGFGSSNGHGRSAGGEPQGAPGVLRVHAEKRGDDARALRGKLLKAAKAEGLDYAYVVRALSDGSESSAEDLSAFTFMGGRGAVGTPIALLYRVHADGSEELMRGARLTPLPLRALREVTGIGREPSILNQMGMQAMGNLFFGFGGGGYLYGMPVTCVSPALLFNAVEVSAKKAGEDRTPYLAHPFFAAHVGP
jgi:TldD protein